RRSAAARITAPITLLQEGSGPGLVIYAPVYRNGLVPTTPSARVAALAGWVCAPFRLDLFVANALPEGREGLSLRIVDVGEDSGGDDAAVEGVPVYPSASAGFPDDRAEGVRHSLVEPVYGRR